MIHPWCRDVSRDEAIRRAEDAAAAERTPLPDHRDLPQAVAELRERVGRLEAVAQPRPEPTTGSESVTPAPASRPAETKQIQAKRVGKGWWFDKSSAPPPPPPPAPPPVFWSNVREGAPPQPDPVQITEGDTLATVRDDGGRPMPKGPPPGLKSHPQPADGLRTERVTLEITLSEAGQRALAMVGEMLSRFPVRVVEASNEADVAGMEYRGNSVGYWYAKAESYRQVVRDCRQQLAAVGGETLAQAAARLTAERDAALRERDAAREECERRLTMCEFMKRQQDAAQFNVSCLKARVAELEAAQAANEGGEVA